MPENGQQDLLFLSLRFPYPPHRGDRIRTYHFLRGLSEKYRISLATFYEDPAELDGLPALQEFCDKVWTVPYSRWRGRLNAAACLLGRAPLQNGVWHSAEMQRAIDEAIEETAPSAIYTQMFRMAQYVADAPQPKLLDLIDALSMNLRRRHQRERNAINRWLLRLEAERVRQYEHEIAERFSVSVVCAPDDRDAILEGAPDLRLEVVPNGVDLEYFQPCRSTESQNGKPTMLFSGTMDYFPNADAAYHLAVEVLPRVRQTVPDAELVVLGINPRRSIRRLDGKNGIKVTGRVPDARPFFEAADVFVSPMRCGSGMQIKNLEAMAMGLPVVTTELGSQGLMAEPGQAYVRANGPERMAESVVRLIQDKDYHASLGQAGRAYVESTHEWTAIAARLADLLAGISGPSPTLAGTQTDGGGVSA